jgi:putative aldouronate transport system permease protein
MKQRWSIFDFVNAFIMIVLGFITVYPFWYLLVVSFSTEEAYYSDPLHLIFRSFNLDAYTYVLGNPTMFRSILISVGVMAVGTISSIVITSMAAYALSKRHLRGSNFFQIMIIITMFFHGGTISTYTMVSKMGLRNNLMVLVLLSLFNTYNLILMRNYFKNAVPESIEEAARIDGCNDFGVLFRIIIPVSKPIIATISLFYAVQYLNDWFTPMMYITRPKLFPLVTVIRNIITASSGVSELPGVAMRNQPDIIKAAALMVSIIPILSAYPFIQRYFVQGIMLGSVKE